MFCTNRFLTEATGVGPVHHSKPGVHTDKASSPLDDIGQQFFWQIFILKLSLGELCSDVGHLRHGQIEERQARPATASRSQPGRGAGCFPLSFQRTLLRYDSVPSFFLHFLQEVVSRGSPVYLIQGLLPPRRVPDGLQNDLPDGALLPPRLQSPLTGRFQRRPRPDELQYLVPGVSLHCRGIDLHVIQFIFPASDIVHQHLVRCEGELGWSLVLADLLQFDPLAELLHDLTPEAKEDSQAGLQCHGVLAHLAHSFSSSLGSTFFSSLLSLAMKNEISRASATRALVGERTLIEREKDRQPIVSPADCTVVSLSLARSLQMFPTFLKNLFNYP